MNPILKRALKSNHGIKAEKRAAKRLKGRERPGSGNQDHSKGDILLPSFLVESKSTVNSSISLKHEWLQKIAKEAIAITREPALIIQFVDGNGRVIPDGGWVMISETRFMEIAHESKNSERLG